ncbi:MAG: LysM peptidoglycan-binding domain-containing C40 family peptidase [Tepidanaerobacteraceae bacterium]|jgi:peptidoglycan endopeptidase LytE|nr:LysM peptidoglycan-binding domain-containing C40 family peptidase [Tepidanaerobacter sp.]
MVNRAKVLISLIAMAVMFCMLPGISYAANYHVVQPKETLWGISRLYGLTVDELFRLNNLQSDLIHPGQRLLVSKDEAEGENFDESHAATEEAAEEEKDLATQIIDFAKTFIGTPYKSAGSSPGGFACSGFTSYVYKQFDIDLPRVAQDQYHFGKAVSSEEAKAGDLVAFAHNGYIHHVGIYMGNGEFIHSSSTEGIVITKTSDIYWGPRLLGYCRVLE